MRAAQRLVLQLLASCWSLQAVAHQQLGGGGGGVEEAPGAALAELLGGAGWGEVESAAQAMQGSVAALGELLLEQAAGNEQLADLRARAGL
jgi:hypothetical protein